MSTSSPKEDSPSLNNMRHSFAHLLAASVKQLWPGTHNAIGPAIENGFYQDFDFGSRKISEEDLPKIEKKMRELVKQWHAFKHWEVTAQEARKLFKDNPYKLELLEELAKENKKITVNDPGNFIDLCKGGHSDNPQKEMRCFKLMSVAGAYWRGDEKRAMLTRIYGVAFSSQKELDAYLAMLEEAKKRDHKVLGKTLGLFTFSELVGPGLPLYTPKGTFVLNQIKNYSRKLRKELGYQEVQTPQINKAELFRVSGHEAKYKESMFSVSSNYTDETYYLKPMNCPQHTQLFASQARSYKDLPVRFADFSLLYRDEKPGELQGLSRLRSFSQDDAHCFCREDQIEEEFTRLLDAVHRTMALYKMDYRIRLSLRDEKKKAGYLGDDGLWKKSQTLLTQLLKKKGVKHFVAEGEAAFYGPKMDLMALDAIDREVQLSTIQLDLNMAKLFGLEYTDEKGNKQTPVMIHSALVGSPERFLGIFIEHVAGAFPLWLAPEQAWIVPISEKFNAYAAKVAVALRKEFPDIRLMVRDENDTLGKKIRAGQTQKIPYLLIVGEKEKKTKTVSVRSYANGDAGAWSMTKLIAQLKKELKLNV